MLVIVHIMLHNMSVNRAKFQNDDNGYLVELHNLLLLFSCLMKAFQYMFSGVVISLKFHNKSGSLQNEVKSFGSGSFIYKIYNDEMNFREGPKWQFLL